jgi:4-hydroxybenzoate polyprenyltransferase
MRTYQWMKNLLLFVPLFTSHKFGSMPLMISEIIAFFAFSLCSSGVYVLNDLLDLPADRTHPRKRKRPFAAGDLPISHGLALAFLAPVTGLILAYLLAPEFCAILALYMVITSAYSIRLKAIAVVDVIILATLYTIRVFAGAVVIEVTLSFWLLTFSMFLFLSLALVKRCSELVMVSGTRGKAASGRGYLVADLDYLHMMGVASGYLAILVVALYINSPDVIAQYSHPQLLWLLCPTLLFWISRVWLKTGRGEMHDDPLIFTMRDTGSRLVALICALTVLFSI